MNTPKEEKADIPHAFAVTVFCGAKSGRGSKYMESACFLAHAFHSEGWSLVYGAGTVGMMGEVARNLVKLGGDVHGIIPEALISVERGRNPQGNSDNRESSYGRLTIVKDMHARKTMMAQAADAFVALPGGFGTLEELMEIVTWNYLGIHAKPIVLFNVDGYYDDIVRWVRKAVEEEFVGVGNKDIVIEARSAEEVVDKIRLYKLPTERYNQNWGKQ